MKMKTVLVAKGTCTKVKITVDAEAPKDVLTRDEMRTWKSELQDKLHKALQDDGYSVGQIKILR